MNRIINIIFFFIPIVTNAQVGYKVGMRAPLVKNIQYSDYDENSKLFRILLDEELLWGCVAEDSIIVIPFEYEYLNPYDSSGITFAEKDGKFGFIDTKNNVIIPFIYQRLSSFRGGLAYAKYNGKYGFIDRKGKVVIPFKYDLLSRFESYGIAEAKLNKKYGFIDKLGNEVIPLKYQDVKSNYIEDTVIVKQDYKWAFFSSKGLQLTDFEFDYIEKQKPYNYINPPYFLYYTFGPVLVSKDGSRTYLKKSFEPLFPFGEFNWASPFNEFGYAVVSDTSDRYGVIDTKGNFIIPYKYEKIRNPQSHWAAFKSDHFIVKRDTLYALYNENCEPLTDFIFKRIYWDLTKTLQDTVVQLYLVTDISDKKGILDNKGKDIVPIIYDELERFHFGHSTFAKLNGKYGIINHLNETIQPFHFDYIRRDFDTDYYIVEKDGLHGILNPSGEFVIEPEFQDIVFIFEEYYEYRFIAKKKDKYGLIALEGDTLLPFIYDYISHSEPYHVVKVNDKYGLVDKFGISLIPLHYEFVSYSSENIIRARKNGKWGIINDENKTVLEFKYDKIFLKQFDKRIKNNTLNEVHVKIGDCYKLINFSGETLSDSIPFEKIKLEYHL